MPPNFPLQDGSKKIILNASAFKETDNQALQGYLQYVKTGKVTTDYTRRIEKVIQTVKISEQARKEYRVLPAVIMDAFDEGIEQGKSLGLAEGEARGSRQKALETAKLMRKRDYPPAEICLMTGLSPAEVEVL